MTRLLTLVTLCWMFTSLYNIRPVEGGILDTLKDVFGLNSGKDDCIFDWEYFATEGNNDNIIIDYSKQHTTTLQEGGKTYNYVTGPITTKSEVGDSYDVFCEIQKYVGGREMQIVLNITKVCYFLENTYPDYLLPIGAKHNDFPSMGNNCPMKVGTTHINKAKDKMELQSPSKLENGKYYLFVSFLDGLKPIGGISGNFTVLRD